MKVFSSFSPRRSGFAPGSVHMNFVVDKVALGQVLFRVLRFSPVNVIPPLLHIHSYIIRGMNKGHFKTTTPNQIFKLQVRIFFVTQTGSWAHSASYPMGAGAISPGGKAVGAWNWPTTSIHSSLHEIGCFKATAKSYIVVLCCDTEWARR
jgi:hypothetical protein